MQSPSAQEQLDKEGGAGEALTAYLLQPSHQYTPLSCTYCTQERLDKERGASEALQRSLERAEQARAELAADLNVTNRKLQGATERIVLMTGGHPACVRRMARLPFQRRWGSSQQL